MLNSLKRWALRGDFYQKRCHSTLQKSKMRHLKGPLWRLNSGLKPNILGSKWSWECHLDDLCQKFNFFKRWAFGGLFIKKVSFGASKKWNESLLKPLEAQIRPHFKNFRVWMKLRVSTYWSNRSKCKMFLKTVLFGGHFIKQVSFLSLKRHRLIKKSP